MSAAKKNSIPLPSGAKLEITLSPFAVSRALAQAVAEEMKSLKLDPKAEVDVNFRKDIFCVLIASKRIEEALFECMKKATYNGKRINEDTFEPEAARDDYLTICVEVAKANILPFGKSLYAELSPLFDAMKISPA